ncbi:hypothetical protein HMPREF1624_02579 [Sporothrix schenckii ATCC 58251]|uniref:AB hydrolase-1 domain-containing protein n=1 Tax=Sporothrix schenckii (strain ATCC 58251 / de Perez 2211183) TaxID=1391915 RepID=U7Q2U7_SPOS1|nr:hypothetical protein HMPREF1624_02579 [Sporothrix schenckii ATCC 58251]
MDDTLPDPTLTLTLPSIHDGTPLDCRIYLPPSVLAVATGSPSAIASLPRWRGHAAIVAHPYGPMGGSYNDPIVKMVAQTLLQPQPQLQPQASSSSFVVATFNFRGAGRKPQGRTSWTAKPEAADYVTIAGFLYYFAHYLDPYGEKEAATSAQPPAPTSAPASRQLLSSPPPTLLFAGYSYGAMVTSLLPPLATILASFARPLRGSPAAEVRLRAARWAAIQNADFAAAMESGSAAAAGGKGSPTKARRGEARLSMGVRVGGGPDEDAQWRRTSHEVGEAGGALRHILHSSPAAPPRRSASADHRPGRGHSHRHSKSDSGNGHANSHVRSHADDLDAHAAKNEESGGGSGGSQRRVSGWMAKIRHGNKDEAAPPPHDDDPKSTTLSAVPNLTVVRPAYLLVSPPVGLATSLATLSFSGAASATGSLFKRKRPERPAPPAPPVTTPAATDDTTSTDSNDDNGDTDDTNSKLACNPTLVVYGDADGFVSLKKIRTWAAGLTAASMAASRGQPVERHRPLFRTQEVATAGHFWAEGRTYYELQEAVRTFAADLATEAQN